ncbi:MAG: hypothetical protein A3B34_00955 [Candidatus Sungbacteria bacterium RIFCSPLOWO2_01_FULL_54_21]|uniref:Uncharacterized protein n=1 Tax=Candidatus Sungbacteria bacterium RIFCSPLOWO2_01_FULL_54_21 TaxID=1802279 RepID=A0A1G2L8L1_9BACT|nr:MAG: hypothetical protein A2679_03520 [Candidatus Sungbacteria bacterium RIFCSPHIGHO2_01_FULL_54_26]OHA07986.1 MAG: hypothetical protein A3B34_00955 [Candidatus Sungbacteria bacterium RIFCSPLOWO2_01_FULL_54_21]
MQYAVANFAYGTGPYLRTTELALAINRERAVRGLPELGVIVPWVYGEKQRRIMREAFADAPLENVLLDKRLGGMLGTIFYGEHTYEQALRLWVERHDALSGEVRRHLSGEIAVEDVRGNTRTVRGSDIVIEISRAGRLAYGVAPVYAVAFGYVSEIMDKVRTIPQEAIALDRELARRAAVLARGVEQSYVFRGRAHPGTFSYQEDEGRHPDGDTAIPPTIDVTAPHDEDIPEGIYVTVTGIPGLERLYREAKALGLRLYANDPDAVPGSEWLSPRAVANPRIRLHFARSGWGSVWLSQLTMTPLVAPSYDPHDDPEIYFNNICVEKLGLGVLYRGQPLADILAHAERLRPRVAALNAALAARFGTLDGNSYAARRITDLMTA